VTFSDWARPSPPASNSKPHEVFTLVEERSFVVLDVDVTGVHPRKDHATGIATLPLKGGRFRLADIRYCPLAASGQWNENPDPAWRPHYRAIVDTAASSLIVTYNIRFVRHMIKRTADLQGLPLPYGRWIDLGAVLNGAIGKEMGQATSLHLWQKRLLVDDIARYSAVADVFAMAQLLAIAITVAEERGIPTLDGVLAEHRSRIWPHRE